MQITMKHSGRFTGAVSGQPIVHEAYQVLELDEAEIAHLDKADFYNGVVSRPRTKMETRQWKKPVALNDPRSFT